MLRLGDILTSLPGSPLPALHHPPRGKWIVCGYGRFGRAVASRFPPAVDPSLTILTAVGAAVAAPYPHRIVPGISADAAGLRAAGIAEAAGIVAGTGQDTANLAIAMTARALNPNVYVVMRQNQAGNTPLFSAFPADDTLVPGRVVAHACLAILTTPLLEQFLRYIREQSDTWAAALGRRLEQLCGELTPQVWSVDLANTEAPALCRALAERASLPLGLLACDPADRRQQLALLPLLVDRRVQRGQGSA